MYSLEGLSKLRRIDGRRVSSYDSKVGNWGSTVVPAGETAVLANMEGAVKVNHFWLTLGSLKNLSGQYRSP